MQRSRIGVVLLTLSGMGAAGLYVSRRGERVPPTAGAIVHAERRVIASTVNATGAIRLRVGKEVRVGSQVSGIVKTLNVTIGSHVKRGEVIAEIDDRPLQARLTDAEAQIAVDRAAMERTQVDYRRAQQLVSNSLIPVQQADDLRLALEEAKAKYDKSLRDADPVKVDLSYVIIRAPISGTVASVSTLKKVEGRR